MHNNFNDIVQNFAQSDIAPKVISIHLQSVLYSHFPTVYASAGYIIMEKYLHMKNGNFHVIVDFLYGQHI